MWRPAILFDGKVMQNFSLNSIEANIGLDLLPEDHQLVLEE
jgi:hypothetical protein